MKQILLHICCAPCSPYVIEELSEKFVVTAFFYDPNIHPEEEYIFRLNEMKHFSKNRNITMIEGEYNPENWFSTISGHEKDSEGGIRCTLCFKMRLDQTATLCKKIGADIFGTVLSVSPHKNSDLLNSIGEKIAREKNISYFPANFKKNNGYQKTVVLAKKYGLKRQNYCGCVYSNK